MLINFLTKKSIKFKLYNKRMSLKRFSFKNKNLSLLRIVIFIFLAIILFSLLETKLKELPRPAIAIIQRIVTKIFL